MLWLLLAVAALVSLRSAHCGAAGAASPRRAVSASLLEGAAATFLRVNFSLLLAAAWTIPVGVAIGFNPQLARISAAAGADCGVGSGDGAVSGDAAGADPARRRTGHRVDCC